VPLSGGGGTDLACGSGNGTPDALMRTGSVEVLNIGVEHAVELLLLQNEQMIEALTPHAFSEAFTGRIRSRGVIRDGEHLDLTRVRHSGEVQPKRAIVVTDEILWPLAKGGGFAQRYARPRHRWETASRRRGSLCASAGQ
jgi:hypothetical protein